MSCWFVCVSLACCVLHVACSLVLVDATLGKKWPWASLWVCGSVVPWFWA